VCDVKDQRAAVARPRQKPRGVCDGSVGIRHGDRAGEVFVLQIDENETGVAQLRGVKVSAGELEQSFGCCHGPKISLSNLSLKEL
jgi:hypothetical protein